jgi:sterol 3beta-glucosyltransferase
VGDVKMYLVTMGSRGDHEPFRALAHEAASRGHDVHFAHTTDLPTDPDAPYTEWPLPGSLNQLIADQGVSVVKALKEYKALWEPTLKGIYDTSSEQIRALRPDVVVYHPKVQTAPVVAHEVGARAVIAEMVPMLTPTTEFAAAGIALSLPGWLNRASYRLVDAGIALFGNPAKKLAQKLGVSSWTPDAVISPVSTTLVSQPRDWPASARITGQWWMAGSESVDEDVESFVAEGNVIYAGFGSMKRGDPVRRARVIVEAARKLGLKTLLVTGWGGLAPDDNLSAAPDVLVRESVNHSTVLPRIHLGIHHGGSGTVHAFLRAGVPSVIMPFIADQPWWAWRLNHAGLGPKAVSPNSRSTDELVSALQQAHLARREVATASEKMAKEKGTLRAVELIEAG